MALAADAARSFLAGAYSPLANAAWQYDAAFGWTNVPVDLMQDYVSAQTRAMRSAGNSRFGFPWSPRNLAGMPAADFNAQTDALLVVPRQLRSPRKHRTPPAAPRGAAAPRRRGDNDCLAHVRRLETVRARLHHRASEPLAGRAVGTADGRAADEQRDGVHGRARRAGADIVLADGQFSTSTGGLDGDPRGHDRFGQSVTSVYYRDSQSGSATITAAAAGKAAAIQGLTVTGDTPPSPPQPPPPPPPAEVPVPVPPGETAPVFTPVAAPVALPPTSPTAPKLRVVGPTQAVVKRHGSTVDATIRFLVGDATGSTRA